MRAVPAVALDLCRIERGLRDGRFVLEDGEILKRCHGCREYWPCDLEFFYSQPRNPDGLNNSCKACYVERRYPDGHHSDSINPEGDSECPIQYPCWTPATLNSLNHGEATSEL